MKKSLKNIEIEKIINVLNHKDSFRNNISVKLPKVIRQAIRIDMKILSERYAIYEEGRKEIYTAYSTDEKAIKQEDGNFLVKPEYRQDLAMELKELALVDNELDLELIDANVFDEFDIALSAPEEDVIEILSKQ